MNFKNNFFCDDSVLFHISMLSNDFVYFLSMYFLMSLYYTVTLTIYVFIDISGVQ